MTNPAPMQEWLIQPGGIADRLRSARKRAGLTGGQVADANGWTQSKISKLENGRQVPTVADLHAWMSTVGAASEADELVEMLEDVQGRHESWRRRLKAGQAAAQASYTDLVRSATVLRDFAMGYFPSMIQTPEYARYPLLKAVKLLGRPADEVDAAVSERMQRQPLLYEPGKRFEFLLDEPILTRLICPPDVLGGQLDRLLGVLGLSNVRLGILPMSARLDLAPENSFTIVDDRVLVETVSDEAEYTDGHRLAVHRQALAAWWEAAVEGAGARRIIVAAAEQLAEMEGRR